MWPELKWMALEHQCLDGLLESVGRRVDWVWPGLLEHQWMAGECWTMCGLGCLSISGWMDVCWRVLDYVLLEYHSVDGWMCAGECWTMCGLGCLSISGWLESVGPCVAWVA